MTVGLPRSAFCNFLCFRWKRQSTKHYFKGNGHALVLSHLVTSLGFLGGDSSSSHRRGLKSWLLALSPVLSFWRLSTCARNSSLRLVGSSWACPGRTLSAYLGDTSAGWSCAFPCIVASEDLGPGPRGRAPVRAERVGCTAVESLLLSPEMYCPASCNKLKSNSNSKPSRSLWCRSRFTISLWGDDHTSRPRQMIMLRPKLMKYDRICQNLMQI